MKNRIFNRNLIIALSVISSILFFMFWLESSYAIKNDNNIQEEDFDYIFDPGEYIGDDEKEAKQEEENTNTNNLNNKDNLVQHPPNKPQEMSSDIENTNMIKKTNDEDKIINPHDDDTYAEEDDLNLEDKVLVKSRINLLNLEKRGYLNIVAFINGQEVLKNVTLDKIEPSKKSLNVNLAVKKETDIVQAGDRDEFFVCAYHVKDLQRESINSLTYFDCDEGDLAGPDEPTISRLFLPSSLVYQESKNIFNNSSSKYSQLITADKSVSNNINQQEEEGEKQKEKDTVKVKVYSPLEDRKNTQKLKIIAMVKGQIKSAVIDNVQEEFDKIGGYTISRTFTFDRDTNIGKIQIGDKFFACVSSTDLNPPEGQECEKRVIKNIGKENVLYAR